MVSQENRIEKRLGVGVGRLVNSSHFPILALLIPRGALMAVTLRLEDNILRKGSRGWSENEK